MNSQHSDNHDKKNSLSNFFKQIVDKKNYANFKVNRLILSSVILGIGILVSLSSKNISFLKNTAHAVIGFGAGLALISPCWISSENLKKQFNAIKELRGSLPLLKQLVILSVTIFLTFYCLAFVLGIIGVSLAMLYYNKNNE